MTHDSSTLPFLDTDDPDTVRYTASPTAHLLDELALYGYRPGQDEPVPRPLPEPEAARCQLQAAVEALETMLTGTRLEDDLADLLWSFVHLFHRKTGRAEAELDRNEQAQRRSHTEQDGSEVKSVELERLVGEGKSLIERRNAFEFFLGDLAAELFERATGSAWRPLAGSKVNRRALTAAMIDSREFIAARRRADAAVLAPSGPRIAFTGGGDFNDHRRIWNTLDKVRASVPTWCCCMAAARAAPNASPPAGPTIARCRKSSSSPTGPWHRNAAPFKRNDRMLEALPIGGVVFPGSGIAANLADKARSLGIPVWRFDPQTAPHRCRLSFRWTYRRDHVPNPVDRPLAGVRSDAS